MSSITFEPRVRDVMPASFGVAVEFRAGSAFELLIGLSALTDARHAADESWVPRLEQCPAPLRRAIERLGDRSGETWLHLLGLALELPAADARQFVAEVEGFDPLELRRHLVGVHVPAWRAIVGAETLERAAAGDPSAAKELLESERYYGGRVRDALPVLLSLTPRQTRSRLLEAMRRFADVFARHERNLVERLERDAGRRRAAAATSPAEAVIAAATGGYLYEPEPEFRSVVLVPHLGAGDALLLCQHRDARVICYPAEDEAGGTGDVEARAVRLGKALGDPARIAILRRLVRGETSLTELADVAGLAKSTAHHHLAALRAAGLVVLRGNARGYWYSLRLEAFAEVRALLAELLQP